MTKGRFQTCNVRVVAPTTKKNKVRDDKTITNSSKSYVVRSQVNLIVEVTLTQNLASMKTQKKMKTGRLQKKREERGSLEDPSLPFSEANRQILKHFGRGKTPRGTGKKYPFWTILKMENGLRLANLTIFTWIYAHLRMEKTPNTQRHRNNSLETTFQGNVSNESSRKPTEILSGKEDPYC